MTPAPSRVRAIASRAHATPSRHQLGSTPPEDSVILTMSVLELISSEVSALLVAAAEANRLAGSRDAQSAAPPLSANPTDDDLEEEEDLEDEDEEDEDLEDEDDVEDEEDEDDFDEEEEDEDEDE